jgi:cytochrome P450
MDAYFRRASAGRSGAPDLLGTLVDARVDGAGLNEPELLAFCGLLLLAGHITTVNLITNAVYSLLEHPDVLDAVIADPALVPGVVEETLRTLPPVRGVGRVATRSVELGGVQVREGQRVIAWIAAANRDQRVFDAPDRFDPHRRPNPHLAFGMGPHFCLGAPLARLEARLALEALAPHLRDLALSTADPPRLVRSELLLGFSHMRLDAV